MTGLYLRLKKVTTNLLKMGTVTINEFSTDGTMAGNSDTALPTEKAVKTYVDTKALEGNELADDLTPSLAADLELDGHDFVDSNGNEQVTFTETADAVNNINIGNAATGSGPAISAVGDDANIDVNVTPKGTGDVKLNGEVVINNLVNFKAAVGTSGVLAGASGAIPLSIPVGAWIVGVTMNNDAAITDDDGNDTYTAAFAGGLVANINGGNAIAAAKNTKVKQIHGCTFGVTTDAVSIALTPNGTNFTGGEVSVTVVYLTIEELVDAA